MGELIGAAPFAVWLREELAEVPGLPPLPATDDEVAEGVGGTGTLTASARELVIDRSRLRAAAAAAGLPAPEGTTVGSFDELSRWALARRAFPLALRSLRNRSGAAGVYRVHGFKDLDGAWQRLQARHPGPALVEPWLDGRARLEVTWFGRGLVFVAQTGIASTMVPRQVWSQFPVALPPAMRPALGAIRHLFQPWIDADQPIRVNLVLTADRLLLISASGGMARPEYAPACHLALGHPGPIERWGESRTGHPASTRPARSGECPVATMDGDASRQPGAEQGGRPSHPPDQTIGAPDAATTPARMARIQWWRLPRDPADAGDTKPGSAPPQPAHPKLDPSHPAARRLREAPRLTAPDENLPPWCRWLRRDGRWQIALIVGNSPRELGERAVVLTNHLGLARLEA